MTFVVAQTECSTFDYSTTVELLVGVTAINSQLSSCNVAVPEDFSFALNNKNILVTVNMNSNEIEQFYVSIANDRISSISSGAPEEYAYYVVLSEATLDDILQSENILDAFFTNLNNENIVVDPQGFMATMTWFFANFFF